MKQKLIGLVLTNWLEVLIDIHNYFQHFNFRSQSDIQLDGSDAMHITSIALLPTDNSDMQKVQT